MPVPMMVEPTLNDSAARQLTSRVEDIFQDAGQQAGRAMSTGIAAGAQDASQSLDRMAEDARTAYRRMGDATEDLAEQERRLQQLRDSGASDVDDQARRVARARGAEEQAIRESTRALDAYERAAREASRAGEAAGSSFTEGLSSADASGAGASAADDFSGGFAAAPALARLGAAGGPIGVALAAAAGLGYAAGRLLMDNINAGMESMQMVDLFGARLGADAETAGRYGEAAARAYANGWGESIEANLSTLQFGLQGGLIDRDASVAEQQELIEQMQGVATLMNEDPQNLARGVRTFLQTDLIGSAEQGLDLLTVATQRGLNLSDDLIDTFEEYGTLFRELGLNGADALGLINQMWEGGARNVDVAADGLKEFSISVVDGSELTRQAFEALGYNADDMAARFAQGGPVARDAMDRILTALGDVDDQQEQNQIGLALFKTKWQDMGDAVKNADLGTAASQLGDIEGATRDATTAMSEHQNQWDILGRNIDTTFTKFQTWLADTQIGKFFSEGLPGFFNLMLGDVTPDINPHTGLPYDTTLPVDQNPPASVPIPDMMLGPLPNSTVLQPPTAVTQPVSPSAADYAEQGPRPTGQQPWPLSELSPVPGQGPVIPPPQTQAPVPMPDVTDEPTTAPAAATTFDPSQYSLGSIPIGAFAGAPMTSTPEAIFSAQSAVINAQESVEQARQRLLTLEQEGTASETELLAARTDVQSAEREYLTAQQELLEAQQGTASQMTDSASSMSSAMGDLGAALDKDLGISEGLAGMADNLVRFLASLAAAPLMGQLSAVSQAAGDEGSGLMGYLATTGAFGPNFMPSRGTAPTATSTGVSPYVTVMPTTVMPMAAAPGQSAVDFAHETMMPFWQSQGLTVGDHQADQYGEHQNGALDIMVDSIAEGNAVLQQVLSDPNVYGAIFDNQVYGYGQGSDPRPYSAGFTGNPTQDHQDHVHAWYQPGGENNITPSATAYAPSYAAPAASYTPSAVNPSPGPSMMNFSPTATTPGAQPNAMNFSTGVPFAAPGGPGLQMSGGLMDGIAGAASALFPGAGAGAQVAMQAIKRTIEFGAQATGIGVSGLMETFLPAGSQKAGSGWLQRIAGAFASAAPALPNMAGGKSPGAPSNGQQGQQAPAGPQIGTQIDQLNYTNQNATEDRAGADLTNHLVAMNSGPGR